ncbi:hypothetical protein STEG23_037435 [Scotinomys teguina]
MSYLYPSPSICCSEKVAEEVEDKEKYYEIPTSGHDMAVIHISFQQLWLSEQDLHKIKPVKISAWIGAGPQAPTLDNRTISSKWLLIKRVTLLRDMEAILQTHKKPWLALIYWLQSPKYCHSPLVECLLAEALGLDEALDQGSQFYPRPEYVVVSAPQVANKIRGTQKLRKVETEGDKKVIKGEQGNRQILSKSPSLLLYLPPRVLRLTGCDKDQNNKRFKVFRQGPDSSKAPMAVIVTIPREPSSSWAAEKQHPAAWKTQDLSSEAFVVDEIEQTWSLRVADVEMLFQLEDKQKVRDFSPGNGRRKDPIHKDWFVPV